MRALVLKDLLVLRKQLRSVFLMLAFFLIYSVMMKSVGFIAGMAVIFCSMMTISSFAYDDLAKWDRYVLALPVTRRQAVLSKYALGLVLACVGTVLSLVIAFLAPIIGDETVLGERLLVVYVMFVIAIIFLSVMLPLIYRYGVERSRLFMFAVFALPALVVYLLAQAGVPVPDVAALHTLLYISPLIVFVVLGVSVSLAERAYAAKES